MLAEVAFVLALAAAQDTAAPKLPQERRTEKKLDDYRTLLENNIFSPPKPKRPDPPRREEKKEEKKPDAPKPPDPILVTGFTFNEAAARYEAVIEDKKKKDVRFCTAGEAVEGWTIVSISHEGMIARKGEEQREFRVGESINGTALAAPLDEKAALGEADVDPKKRDEARERLRQKNREKKAMVDDEAEDAPVEKKNKKDK